MRNSRRDRAGAGIVKSYGLAVCLAALLLAAPAAAQDFSALARVDASQSQIRAWRQGAEIVLDISQPVPFRVFTLDAPRRLVIDFREVDWTGLARDAIWDGPDSRISALRFGALRPGWSRMVVDLAQPLVIETAGMATTDSDGKARLTVRLIPASEDGFAEASGAPPDPGWDSLVATDVTQSALPPRDDGIVVVAIDPGHGGVDPGAERDGVVEAELMLILARELAEAINRTEGMRSVLTRGSDVFVALDERMTQARLAGADVMISLHADALDEDETHGASIYTLDADAQDAASARMAERHDRGDLVAGLDLKGQDDTVATVLMDLARQETAPQSERLADAIVAALEETGAELNSRPRRHAALAVLNAADFASVLVEVGFLSNADDRAALSVQPGRATIIRGLVLALQRWAVDEAARAQLLRR